ncbi:TetR/AcrR family transcriptional regulator [Streptacidiphilus jiangxiensis]|uniref:DNA-binding transcriptional regulator, AcrR family n=1 Tax=Streptacidiphilus jiangxiensis TaxID=235985 RepID=A0A1H7YX28_STRJI|nr:TetR/AcrR family transcriptional regulator [Streptacidiphilus jiangxiensis]SEM50525.1 DNA-binding transcriptional regulator, AcrR family [Streptacidiphilus jiangxiensis]
MTSSLRSEYREQTRRRLLDAVREVLEETDYAAATVDEIVRRAGASRATFYVHFRSKAEAAAALLDRVTPSDRGVYATLPKALGTRAGLRRWLEASLGWYEAHARLLAALNEAMAVEGTVARGRSAAVERLVEALPEYLERCGDPARARVRLQLLLRQFHQVAMDTVVQGAWQPDRDLLLDELAGAWWAVLGGVEPEAVSGN